jgi:homoserine dehydrogenase
VLGAAAAIVPAYVPDRAARHVATVGEQQVNANEPVDCAVPWSPRARVRRDVEDLPALGLDRLIRDAVLLRMRPRWWVRSATGRRRESPRGSLVAWGRWHAKALRTCPARWHRPAAVSRILKARILAERMVSSASGELPESADQRHIQRARTPSQVNAERVIERARAGEDFERLAVQYGADRRNEVDQGWIPDGLLVPEALAALAGVGAGDVSAPSQDGLFFDVYRVAEFEAARPLTDEQRTNLSQRRVEDWTKEQEAQLRIERDLSDGESEDHEARCGSRACGVRGADGEAVTEPVGVALLGAGNVGGGVLGALAAGAGRYAARVGRPLEVRHVLVRDASRRRKGIAKRVLVESLDAVLADARTRIVVEVMGGEQPAYEYIRRCLEAGRHVVTANKEVMAKHGGELLRTASAHSVRLYEASVGGGIQNISPISRDLLANEVTGVTAIIHGTTNYMLTAMAQRGSDYADVLAEAQRLGYAEPDPTADVEGIDAAYKLAILCGLAFHVEVSPADVTRTGITRLTARDFRYARELGYAIKLLASGRLEQGELVATVQPAVVPQGEPLARVDGVLNAVQVEGDLVGRVLFEGPGAGPMPTASAVLADVLDIARDLVAGRPPAETIAYRTVVVRPASAVVSRPYLRVTRSTARRAGADRDDPDARDPIASVIQFEPTPPQARRSW